MTKKKAKKKKAKKKTGKNRTPVRKRATIWTTADAVYAYLNTIKEREMPDEFSIFVQHVLLVYLKDLDKPKSKGRKMLGQCYEALCYDAKRLKEGTWGI